MALSGQETPVSRRGLTISEVANRFGLRASALRYYEQIGILPEAIRVGGQRRYDATLLRRLAVIQRARQVGFSLEEITQLFSGFDKSTPASKRWRLLAENKLAELEQAQASIATMQDLLRGMARCDCDALDECGEGLLNRNCSGPSTNGLIVPAPTTASAARRARTNASRPRTRMG
jgi:MerR family transcriptional regulator, redox-sensitive transcriptional activator SoxR